MNNLDRYFMPSDRESLRTWIRTGMDKKRVEIVQLVERRRKWPAEEKARAKPESASVPVSAPGAAVLQADRNLCSALRNDSSLLAMATRPARSFTVARLAPTNATSRRR